MAIKGKTSTPNGYSYTLCLKCSNTNGGAHTRVLKFTQRRDCNLVLTPLARTFDLNQEYVAPPEIPACPVGKTCHTSTEDNFNWIITSNVKIVGTAVATHNTLSNWQQCIDKCDDDWRCKTAQYKAGTCTLHAEEAFDTKHTTDNGNTRFSKVHGFAGCEWVYLNSESRPCCDTEANCTATAAAKCENNYAMPNFQDGTANSPEKKCCACGKEGVCRLKDVYANPPTAT